MVHDIREDTTVPGRSRAARRVPRCARPPQHLGRGVLNAMKAGIAWRRAPYVLVTMADGSDEPRTWTAMVALARNGADVVAASRYMRGGRQVGGPPPEAPHVPERGPHRSTGSRGVPIHDPTNNFKLYSRRFLDAMTIESAAGFELAIELSVKATLAGPPPGRGSHDVARPDRRGEQLPPPQVAAALPALVPAGLPRPLAATPQPSDHRPDQGAAGGSCRSRRAPAARRAKTPSSGPGRAHASGSAGGPVALGGAGNAAQVGHA